MAPGKQFDEMLLKIFSYMSVEDLSLSTCNVIMRWKEMSQHSTLWKNAIFSPREEISNLEIVQYLENMPALKSYSSTRETSDIVIETLCRCCRNIQSIQLHKSHFVEVSLLQKIIHHFPHIVSLKLPVPHVVRFLKLAELIGKCQSLGSLTLVKYEDYGFEGHGPVTYKGILVPIADGCPSLQHIHLNYFDDIIFYLFLV
jgi:hypothetical protein